MPTDPVEHQPEDDWAWRLVKNRASGNATLELGDMYADAPDQVVNALLRVIGENLIKAGTQMMQSRLVDDDGDDGWDDGWDDDDYA